MSKQALPKEVQQAVLAFAWLKDNNARINSMTILVGEDRYTISYEGNWSVAVKAEIGYITSFMARKKLLVLSEELSRVNTRLSPKHVDTRSMSIAASAVNPRLVEAARLRVAKVSELRERQSDMQVEMARLQLLSELKASWTDVFSLTEVLDESIIELCQPTSSSRPEGTASKKATRSARPREKSSETESGTAESSQESTSVDISAE